MIDKKELRIGNSVMYDNRIFQISAITDEFPLLNTPEFGIGVVDWNNLHPIPITEEALVKMGFEKRGNDWHIGFNPITHDWLFYIVWLDGYESPFYKNGHHHIKYIHQLCNLYHSLTQTELTHE